MSTPIPVPPTAGPSTQPSTNGIPPQTQGDAKKRVEPDPDQIRRTKQPRPPLPPPHILASLVPESVAFNELLDVEAKLDWTLMRKRAEINDTLGRPVKVKRNIRVFISNTAHDQTWQAAQSAQAVIDFDVSMNAAVESKDSGDGVENGDQPSGGTGNDVDLSTGKGIPGWVLRVEGRLLDSGNVRIDKTKRKFSTFLRRVVVEFDNREPPTYPEGNVVEWSPANQPPTDGFEILRRGDSNVNCRIILDIAHYPERYRITSPLSELIASKEGTRGEIISAVWKLIKIAGAQDKEDPTIVRPVGGLEKLMMPGQDGVPFHDIPQLVTRFLAHPDPVVIPYTIRVDRDYQFHDKCFDIPVEMEDPLKSKMADLLKRIEGDEGKEIMELEDKVGELVYHARELKQKRDFLEAFATNPQAFIQNWLQAQARDLDEMLGFQIGVASLNGGSVREEDLRRSDLFTMPWVDEAIVVHESARMEQERRQHGKR
ncbi:hypothetical protein TREMEDRAFT_42914 [Tremella mesenterica DSM 1558]|uniref:uncharacterized protein n=1 Tax=Tremella mesenterica (strain ATCC 24925 / CBS 8224 / DSM 1558 / NBRC 9311 / NRRL Y-6157 / RJB 2259-6 / UBC 559-6) TaxID=578456 RepID=UPI0003F48DBE|nr:uncharacterized protein TREMEDRAFT_42914 [Tremella mesenterica DSM 1558]EIW71550.1 hypothetical protein TREMEDRAFT_42914 [Tremella mesenterica DSM 1558]